MQKRASVNLSGSQSRALSRLKNWTQAVYVSSYDLMCNHEALNQLVSLGPAERSPIFPNRFKLA